MIPPPKVHIDEANGLLDVPVLTCADGFERLCLARALLERAKCADLRRAAVGDPDRAAGIAAMAKFAKRLARTNTAFRHACLTFHEERAGFVPPGTKLRGAAKHRR